MVEIDSRLDQIAKDYAERYGGLVTQRQAVKALSQSYVSRSEGSLLDALAATAAVHAMFFADQVDMEAVSPQMEEAFRLAFPGKDLAERLEQLRGLDPDSREVTGFLAPWKGKYFEVLLRDRLNNGEELGGVALREGQRAVLAEGPTQPGWDLQILNGDGTEASILQAKATERISYVREHLERYPDIRVITTDEAAERAVDERVLGSGISDEGLEEQVSAPMDEVWDSVAEEAVEVALSGLPFVIIGTWEGGKVLMGKQSFQCAVERVAERSLKTSAAIGAGALATLAGAGALSLPAGFLARMGIERHILRARLAGKVSSDRAELARLLPEA